MKEFDDDAPLPLSKIRDVVSDTTFIWLQNAEEEEAKRDAELLDDEAAYATALFQQIAHANDNDEGSSEEKYERVHEWRSSLVNPDGFGGTNVYHDEPESEASKSNLEEGTSAVSVKYILSDASGGHGDDLWAAARHIANMLADPIKCQKLLGPSFFTTTTCGDNGNENENENENEDIHMNSIDSDDHSHPLFGKTMIELGSGAGVPSWTAMKCGAKVVCTDQSIPNRIRCMAECAQRNLYEMKLSHENEKVDHDDTNKSHQDGRKNALFYAEKIKCCPYDWGNSIDDIIKLLNDDDGNVKSTHHQHSFDVVVAADCIYMPHCHSLLLDSIKLLLRKGGGGVALLPFALHGNTRDETVWSIVDLAKDRGFQVVVLEPQQLTPQGAFMESKRALVHTLRLTI